MRDIHRGWILLLALKNFLNIFNQQKTKIPVNKLSVDVFTKIQDKVDKHLLAILNEPSNKDEIAPYRDLKAFFRSCMNTAQIELRGVKPVTDVLDLIGGWPILRKNIETLEKWSWKVAIAEAYRLGFEANYFFSVDVTDDPEDPEGNILSVRRDINSEDFVLFI